VTGRLATHPGNTTVKIQIIWTRLSSNLIGSKSPNESADNEYSPHQQNASKIFYSTEAAVGPKNLKMYHIYFNLRFN